MADAQHQSTREVVVQNREGLHARPIMRFVDLASTFSSSVRVTNVTRSTEPVDGKSAMQMMLLEATQGSVLRVEARGEDAQRAIEALGDLIEKGPTPEHRGESGEDAGDRPPADQP